MNAWLLEPILRTQLPLVRPQALQMRLREGLVRPNDGLLLDHVSDGFGNRLPGSLTLGPGDVGVENERISGVVDHDQTKQLAEFGAGTGKLMVGYDARIELSCGQNVRARHRAAVLLPRVLNPDGRRVELALIRGVDYTNLRVLLHAGDRDLSQAQPGRLVHEENRLLRTGGNRLYLLQMRP